MGDRTVRPDMRGRVTEETIANWANMAVVLFGLLAAGAGVCALYFNARASTALTTEASQAIEAADARAAAAEGALREVHQRIDPRRLSAGQQQELAALLSASVDKGPVTVTSVAGDLEGKILADQIDGVLKAAEWPTNGVAEGTYAGADPVGLGVVVQNPNEPPGRAGTLLNAFEQVELPIGVAEDPDLDDDSVTILVGVKP